MRIKDPEALTPAAQRLLNLIVRTIVSGRIEPGRPDSYLGYRETHRKLGLQRRSGTWGQSLKHQGLYDLAVWIKNRRLPALTGLIVDTTKRNRPGFGYFEMFNNGVESDGWWHAEVRRAVEHDWGPYSKEPKLPTRQELRSYERYTEGRRGTITLQTRRRCEALKRRARSAFASPGGELRCAACRWSRPSHALRSSIVEIHHILPIAQLGRKGVTRTLKEALKLMAPLCPNCHRVVHARPGGGSYSLEELKLLVGRPRDARPHG